MVKGYSWLLKSVYLSLIFFVGIQLKEIAASLSKLYEYIYMGGEGAELF